VAKQLKLEVLLAAVDKVTRPLKTMNETAGKVSAEFRQTKSRLNDLNKQAGMIDGYRKSNSALQATSAKLENAREKASRLAREFKATENPTKAMKRELDNARSTVKSLDNSKTKLTRTVQEQRQKLEQNGVSTKNLSAARSKLRNETKRLNNELAQQKDRLSAVTKQQERLNKVSKTYQQTRELQQKMAGAGTKMLATGGAALYGGARMLAPGLDFGEVMSSVQAKTGLEKDNPLFIALKEQARELGATTSFAATEVAAGQDFLAMAGFDPKEITQAMPDMLALSKATGTALDQTSDIASNIMGAYDIPATEMGRIADVLSATTSSANVDLSMLGDTMKYVGPIAKKMNVGLEESAAMAGLLGNIGIQGSQAGTVMRSMLNRLASQTGPAKDAIAELGVTTKDAAGNLRAVPDILQDVVKATDGMGNADQAGYLKAIFGEEAGAGVAQLIEEQGAGQIEKLTAALQSSQGRAQQMADVMADNAAGDLKSLGSAWDDVRIELFESNDGPIRDLIQSVTEIVRNIGDWMKQNPELAATLAKVAAVIAALVTVGGALALTIAGLLGPIAAARMAFSILHIKTFPGVTVAAKAAGRALLSTGKSALIAAKSTGVKAWNFLTGKIKAATAATASYRKSNGLLATVMASSKAALLGVGKTITGAVLAPLKFLKLAIMGVTKALVMNPIGAIIAAIAVAALLIYKYWEPIKAFFIGMWQGIKEAFAPVGELMTDIFSEVGQVLAPLKPLWDGIASVLGKVWGWISQLFKPFQATSENLQGATDAGRSFGKIFASVFLFIPKLVLGAVKMVIGIFKKIPGAVSAVWDALKKIFWWSPVGLIIKAFSKAFDWLTNIDWAGIAGRAWETIKTIFKWSPLGLIVRGFSAAFNWIANIDWAGYASAAWERLKQVFSWSPLGLIIRGFTKAFSWITSIDWAGKASSAWESIKSVFSWSPLEAIKNGFNAALNFLRGLPTKFSQLGSDILSGLVDGITGALGKVKDGIVEAASSVSSWFKETLGINSPSKVFMLHGDDTMRGLALGLRGNDEPVKEVNRTSGQLKKAAAGMAITAAVSMPVAAEQPADLVRNIKYQEESLNLPGIQDTVQRIQTREIERTTETQQATQKSQRPVTVESNLNISEGAIVIHAGDKSDAREIARQVEQALERIERKRAIENRSKLRDLD